MDALHVTRTETSHVINMTWLLPEISRFGLMGRDQVWIPSLNLPGGSVALGDPVRRLVPATTAPLYDRSALHAELERLIAVHPPALSGWSSVVIHLLLFLVAAALLLVLWFWVPRLIWGERFQSAAVPVGRWANRDRASGQTRQPVTSASGVQIRPSTAPAGFQATVDNAGVLQRSAAQTTQVGLRADNAKSRLDFE